MLFGSLKKKIKAVMTLLIITAMVLPLFYMHSSTAEAQRTAQTRVVSAGSGHSLAVRGDGSVWAWGYNGYGQLGDGYTDDRTKPLQTVDLEKVRDVKAGSGFSLAVKRDNTVWAWGRNTSGQLGDGSRTNRTTPVQVRGLTDVQAISSGFTHSIALKNDGTVWTWGSNTHGQLGDGTTTDKILPVQVYGLAGVVGVSAGNGYSLAVKRDGTVWAWGSNQWGQLGDGSLTSKNKPVQVFELSGMMEVSAGRDHVLALKEDGTVWAWGRNQYGQLGLGNRINEIAPVQVPDLRGVISVSAGEEHSLAVRVNGDLWCWGANGYGQLGDQTVIDKTSPVRMIVLTGMTDISAGSGYSLAVKSDGTAWAWGYNDRGELGDGTTENRLFPVQVDFTVIITLKSSPGVMGGLVSGDGNYEQGSWATVRATPADGYVFLNWTERDKVVSENSHYVFTADEDRTLVANFSSLLELLTDYLEDNYPNYKKVDGYQGEIEEDQDSRLYKYEAPGDKDLIVMLGWLDTEVELRLSVYDPDEELYEEVDGNDPPLVLEIDEAEEGEWSYQVTGLEVPEETTYAVLVGLNNPSSGNPPSDNENNRVPGDLDGSGDIGVNDVILAMRHVLELELLDSEQVSYADVNNSGDVNINDVTLIMQKALGLIDEFPI